MLHLISRVPTPPDFDTFFENFYRKDQHNDALRKAVEHEWRVLLENPTTISLLIEDMTPKSGCRIVGCAQLAFVSGKFVRWVRRGERPWVNALATRRMPDGSLPLLTPTEARRAQNDEDLYALFTRWARAGTLNNEREKQQVNAFMDTAFETRVQGYSYQEMLIEAVGENARQQALTVGFEERANYEDYYRANPPLPNKDARPYLMGITREEAAAREGRRIAHFFSYLPPHLGLTLEDRELLYCALRGDSDKEIAGFLPISLSGVQKRWQAIYTRVEERMPELLPRRDDQLNESVRGPEKRRRLLEYLRTHPEELRTPGLS